MIKSKLYSTAYKVINDMAPANSHLLLCYSLPNFLSLPTLVFLFFSLTIHTYSHLVHLYFLLFLEVSFCFCCIVMLSCFHLSTLGWNYFLVGPTLTKITHSLHVVIYFLPSRRLIIVLCFFLIHLFDYCLFLYFYFIDSDSAGAWSWI